MQRPSLFSLVEFLKLNCQQGQPAGFGYQEIVVQLWVSRVILTEGLHARKEEMMTLTEGLYAKKEETMTRRKFMHEEMKLRW